MPVCKAGSKEAVSGGLQVQSQRRERDSTLKTYTKEQMKARKMAQQIKDSAVMGLNLGICKVKGVSIISLPHVSGDTILFYTQNMQIS